MNIQIVLVAVVGLYASVMLLASLAGAFEPKVRDVFIISCMILLWVLGGRIAAEKVDRLPNSLQQTQGASGVAK